MNNFTRALLLISDKPEDYLDLGPDDRDQNRGIQCLGGNVEDPKPARPDPHAEIGEPGYIPTVEVIRLVKSNFEPDYIRIRATAEGYKQFGPTDADSAFDDCVAIECACRDLLAAQSWLLDEPTQYEKDQENQS
jgi:hypothetical protein